MTAPVHHDARKMHRSVGALLLAATAGAVPTAPASNLCWFWADSARVNGYCDYCVTP